ncbi:MAG: hypothetical protein AABY40_00610, partial [Nanoarchaeota archaeon]
MEPFPGRVVIAIVAISFILVGGTYLFVSQGQLQDSIFDNNPVTLTATAVAFSSLNCVRFNLGIRGSYTDQEPLPATGGSPIIISTLSLAEGFYVKWNGGTPVGDSHFAIRCKFTVSPSESARFVVGGGAQVNKQ